MILQELKQHHEFFRIHNLKYYTELFSKPIWGDMGEDCASITLSALPEEWKLHFIRTQSGEPYPLSDTVCNVIDEYEKILDDNGLYELLSLHRKLDEFELYIKEQQKKVD